MIELIEESAVIGRRLQHLCVPTEISAPRSLVRPSLLAGIPDVAGTKTPRCLTDA
jgi:hypothetical protein